VKPLSVVVACARACARPPRAPRGRPARSGRRDTHVGRRCGRPVAHRCDPRCADQGGPCGVQPGRILVPLDFPPSNIRQKWVGFLRVFWFGMPIGKTHAPWEFETMESRGPSRCRAATSLSAEAAGTESTPRRPRGSTMVTAQARARPKVGRPRWWIDSLPPEPE